MNFQKPNIQLAYIGGGSRGWAWGLMSDLALDESISGCVRLYDIDKQAAENNKIIGNNISKSSKAKAFWEYKTANTLGEALSGCDFVVISILPGSFEHMQSDVHAPEKYGVYQAVGDSTGPGGFMRSLRTIPMFREIARAIKENAPDAWVINYTNPMTVCVRTLYEEFPQIKALGCCHEVFGTQSLLCAMLAEEAGIKDIPREEIKVGITGINHFTWITQASYKGSNLFDMYEKFAEKYYETGYDKGKDDNWMNNSFDCAHRVKFDLFKRYGLIAAAGDRHLAEFVPWYLKSPQSVKEWKFGLTPVSWRVNDLKQRLEKSHRLVNGEQPEINPTGEEGHIIMKALLGMCELVTNVNIPNKGQISNLPLGAVVETNALIRKNSVKPVLEGDMPSGVLALTMRHVINQENTVKCVFERSKTLAFETFAADPLISHLPVQALQELFSQMTSAQKEYIEKEFLM